MKPFDHEKLHELEAAVEEYSDNGFAYFWVADYKALVAMAKTSLQLREELATAARYLQAGKIKFGVQTTNSLVDRFIEKWG